MSQYFNSDSVLFGTWNKHVEFAFHYKIMFATDTKKIYFLIIGVHLQEGSISVFLHQNSVIY